MKHMMVCLLACLCLTGCEMLPFARELESTMLVQVLGVDQSGGEVVLTGASDPGGGQAPVLSAAGPDLEQAKAALKAAGEEYVALTHVTQLVLGAETDLQKVLEAVLEESSLGQSATVWLTEEGTARELMGQVDGGAKRLSSIELNGPVKPVTVLQSVAGLEERGRVTLPVIGIREDVLVPVGTREILEDRNEK